MKAPPVSELWIGTTRRNLPGILQHGLVPGAGASPHGTRSTGNVFLADITGALMYADAYGDMRWPTGARKRRKTGEEPALIRVNTAGLDLEPDTDDLDTEIDEYLDAVATESGVDVYDRRDEVLDAAEAEAVEAAIEVLHHEPVGAGTVYGALVDTPKGDVLGIVPVHRIGIPEEVYAWPDLVMDYAEFIADPYGDGYAVETLQYMHRGPIPLSRVTGVYILARRARPDLVLETYNRIVSRGRRAWWPKLRFRRLTGPQARRLLR